MRFPMRMGRSKVDFSNPDNVEMNAEISADHINVWKRALLSDYQNSSELKQILEHQASLAKNNFQIFLLPRSSSVALGAEIKFDVFYYAVEPHGPVFSHFGCVDTHVLFHTPEALSRNNRMRRDNLLGSSFAALDLGWELVYNLEVEQLEADQTVTDISPVALFAEQTRPRSSMDRRSSGKISYKRRDIAWPWEDGEVVQERPNFAEQRDIEALNRLASLKDPRSLNAFLEVAKHRAYSKIYSQLARQRAVELIAELATYWFDIQIIGAINRLKLQRKSLGRKEREGVAGCIDKLEAELEHRRSGGVRTTFFPDYKQLNSDHRGEGLVDGLFVLAVGFGKEVADSINQINEELQTRSFNASLAHTRETTRLARTFLEGSYSTVINIPNMGLGLTTSGAEGLAGYQLGQQITGTVGLGLFLALTIYSVGPSVVRGVRVGFQRLSSAKNPTPSPRTYPANPFPDYLRKGPANSFQRSSHPGPTVHPENFYHIVETSFGDGPAATSVKNATRPQTSSLAIARPKLGKVEVLPVRVFDPQLAPTVALESWGPINATPVFLPLQDEFTNPFFPLKDAVGVLGPGLLTGTNRDYQRRFYVSTPAKQFTPGASIAFSVVVKDQRYQTQSYFLLEAQDFYELSDQLEFYLGYTDESWNYLRVEFSAGKDGETGVVIVKDKDGLHQLQLGQDFGDGSIRQLTLGRFEQVQGSLGQAGQSESHSGPKAQMSKDGKTRLAPQGVNFREMELTESDRKIQRYLVIKWLKGLDPANFHLLTQEEAELLLLNLILAQLLHNPTTDNVNSAGMIRDICLYHLLNVETGLYSWLLKLLKDHKIGVGPLGPPQFAFGLRLLVATILTFERLDIDPTYVDIKIVQEIVQLMHDTESYLMWVLLAPRFVIETFVKGFPQMHDEFFESFANADTTVETFGNAFLLHAAMRDQLLCLIMEDLTGLTSSFGEFYHDYLVPLLEDDVATLYMKDFLNVAFSQVHQDEVQSLIESGDHSTDTVQTDFSIGLLNKMQEEESYEELEDEEGPLLEWQKDSDWWKPQEAKEQKEEGPNYFGEDEGFEGRLSELSEKMRFTIWTKLFMAMESLNLKFDGLFWDRMEDTLDLYEDLDVALDFAWDLAETKPGPPADQEKTGSD